jgi:acetyltransferase-like isoleucine patch superfamily enzyme
MSETPWDKRDYRWAAVRRIERQRRSLGLAYYGRRAALSAAYWGVELGQSCSFYGPIMFNRTGYSRIAIGSDCVFRSAYWSNEIGVNRPCMLSTLAPEAELLIGDRCGLSGTVIAASESVVLGDDVLCGANVTIMDSDLHSPEFPSAREAPHAPVVIEAGAWLGLNAVVLKGVTIGRGSVVAAGSIVVTSVPPRVIVAGQPAVVIRELSPSADFPPRHA